MPRMAIPSAPPNSALVSESRRCPGPFRWSCPDCQIGCQGVHRGQSQGEDNRSGNQHEQAGCTAGAELGEQPEADRRQRQACSHHEGRTNPARQQRRQHRPDDETHARRAASTARRKAATARARAAGTGRRTDNVPKPTKKLAALVAMAALKAGIRNSRRSISGSARRTLAAHERHAGECAGQESKRRQPTGTVLGELLEAVDHRQHRHERQDRAEQVQSSGPRIAVLGQQERPQHQQQRHHRHGEQEHRRPTRRCSSSTPPTSGPIAPPAEKLAIHTPIATVRCAVVEEHVADQRQGRRRQGRAGHARAARASRSASRRWWRRPPAPRRRRTRPRRSAAACGGRCGRPACPW